MDKKVVCAVPWMHLAFEPSGKVIPCCLTSTFNYFSGDLNNTPIEKIWNSENQKKLRKQMMNGEKPEICVKCYKKEEVDGQSGRTHHNKQNQDLINSIKDITTEDGAVKDMKLRYWDFRFSNLCNFKCRSCGPRYSSAWVPDAKKLGWITKQEKVSNIENSTNLGTKLDFLKTQVPYVKRIYFAGGEPLMMPEHWQVLEMLDKEKKYDVRIDYNTNISKLEYGGKNVIDYWKKWDTSNGPRINVWPSIDEIGKRGELIRAGTHWPTVEKNLKTLAGLKKHIAIEPSITVGAMNVARLPEIITHLADLGVIGDHPHSPYQNFYLNLLEYPAHFHVKILHNRERVKIIEKLNKFIDEWREKYNVDITHRFKQILHELTLPHNIREAKKFLQKTYELDELRKEYTFDVIPELRPLLQSYTGIYLRKKPIAIKQKPSAFYVTWVINNICTNACSYCPPMLHNGSNHHYDWDHAKKFLDHIFEQHENVHVSIAGGEPSVCPFLPKLVKYINEKGGTVGVTTNLAKSVRYWNDIAPYFEYISTSYHPSFEDKEYFTKLMTCALHTKTYSRIMMDTRHWDKSVQAYKIACELKHVTVEPVRIMDWIKGDFTGCDYTKEQLEWIQDKDVREGEKKEFYKRNIIGGTLTNSDGSEILGFNANEMVNRGQTDFRGWSCDIGLKSIFVNFDGSLRKANCLQGPKLGNIQDFDNIKWPTKPEICKIARCHCATDVFVDKKDLSYE